MFDANPVRLERLAPKLVEFPADRILWARTPGDEVAVTHRAQTIVYDSPADLADAVREADGRGRELLKLAEQALGRARALEQKAQLTHDQAALALAEANTAKARATLLLRHVEAGIVVGVVAAIVACGAGL